MKILKIKIAVLTIVLSVGLSFAQNNQLLYDFGSVPQKLFHNPGGDIEFPKYHVQIPLLQLSLDIGFTGHSYYDIFSDGGDPVSKFTTLLDELNYEEFLSFNMQVDVINLGYKISNRSYLTAGYYIEANTFLSLPKDVALLYFEGNTDQATYSINGLKASGDVLGAFYVGLTHKVNETLTIGGRLKIYSGAVNINSIKNSGGFVTELNNDGEKDQYLRDIYIDAKTSGVQSEVDFKSAFLFGGNLGVGVDMGFTRWISRNWKISGSVIDLGFMYNSKEVEGYKVEGTHKIDHFQVTYDNSIDYKMIYDELLKENVSEVKDNDSYFTMRPVKFYGALSYSFQYEELRNCDILEKNAPFLSKVGVQFYTNVNPVKSYLEATLFYERKIGSFLTTRLSYTVDKFSAKNLGAALNLRVGAFNLFIAADNLLNSINIYNATNQGVQLGANWVFK